MATNNTTRKDFDFDAYTAVMKTANSGLKLFLAEQMLGDVAGMYARYRNPLVSDVMEIVENLADLRVKNKEAATKANRQTPEGRPATPADRPAFDANQFEPAIY